jgi:hypothetical protein
VIALRYYSLPGGLSACLNISDMTSSIAITSLNAVWSSIFVASENIASCTILRENDIDAVTFIMALTIQATFASWECICSSLSTKPGCAQEKWPSLFGATICSLHFSMRAKAIMSTVECHDRATNDCVVRQALMSWVRISRMVVPFVLLFDR